MLQILGGTDLETTVGAGLDPIALLFLFLAAVLAVVGCLVGFVFYWRARAMRSARAKGGENAQVTLRVTIPRYKNQDEARQNDTPATIKEKIAIAETLYAAIGGLKPEKGFNAWLKGRNDVFAFELVAHEKLVTFYVTVPKKHQEFFEQQLHAQWSDAYLEEIVDYNIFSPTGVTVAGHVKFKRENAFPIKTFKEIEGDPVNALTNALSKVLETDGVAVQFLVRPAASDWRAFGSKIVRNMQAGMTLEEAKTGATKAGWMSSKEDIEKQAAKRRERRLSAAETKMLEGIENKMTKAALEVNIRIVASAQTADMAQAYLGNVLQAFSQYSIYEYGNSFEKSIPRTKRKIIDEFIFRLFDDSHRLIANTEELASLWHLPLASTETPNIRWMLARTQPAPTNIPKEGLLVGYNEYRGVRTDIHMTDSDRRRHMYIIGKTGSGKSEFIKNMAVQDIRNGKGVCIIDPHGDLADGVLELIPKNRIDDVVYFNPSDLERPMGLNMLESPNDEMRDFVVQEMISIFYMLFPPEMIGPMFEHNMRNYMLTLMADVQNPGTIVEIPRMIADEAFQKEWVSKVKDPVVRSFWEDEMAKTSDYHKSEMMGYLVSKVGRFVENEMMRNIIGQQKSAFNFREIMDKKQILLVNLSKGKTGEVNASLLGLILVAKLQMAAFSRADIPESERHDFYLYIDEFQNFITPSIATILSEARKYRLNMILAHQYMGQLVKDGKSEIRDAVLGNVGNMFVARVGPEDVETLEKVFAPTFSGYDLMNTDMYTWNVKMIIENAQAKPFTMKAIPIEKGNRRVGDALKEISRLQYGQDKSIVERDIMERSGMNKARPVAPPVKPPMG
ncbi:type IV secretion system DNA-binding domain-containing protein [Patescibacteria group bacterium]|nr:type IV secretion system DNA-binding domain-containing protein [Patescibacteria group bacterium]